MKKLLPQFVALVVLVLIEVAVLREALLAGVATTWVDWMAWILALLLLIQAVVQTFQELRSGEVQPGNLWLGTLLLVAGWSIFFLFPEFFDAVLSTHQDHYFATVSWYSLPAVLVEGGLFSVLGWLLINYQNHLKIAGPLERLAPWLLGFYAAVAIGSNFLAIHGLASVDFHILISRWASTMMLVFWLATILFIRVKKISRSKVS